MRADKGGDHPAPPAGKTGGGLSLIDAGGYRNTQVIGATGARSRSNDVVIMRRARVSIERRMVGMFATVACSFMGTRTGRW